MSQRIWTRIVVCCVVALFVTGVAEAQQCNDFQECTRNDMCTDGICMGTPATSGSCDDFNDCTVNDRCTSVEGFAVCMGDPATIGTGCQGGCGTCQSAFPVPIPLPDIPLVCKPKAGSVGTECESPQGSEFGPCYIARCREFGGGGFSIASCIPGPVNCPDTDGNACTDGCNPQTGRCERIEVGCGYPECTRCNPSNGSCEHVNDGRSCNDFNDCTSQSRCESGNCVEGEPSGGGATPTSTSVPAGNTPTATNTAQQATPTVPATSTCAVDCNNDNQVLINELVTAVGIGLGTNSLDQCRAADVNNDGSVGVNEVIQGVNNGQNSCPA